MTPFDDYRLDSSPNDGGSKGDATPIDPDSAADGGAIGDGGDASDDGACGDGPCPICEPGVSWCLSPRVLGTCTADGTGWREDACPLGCNDVALDCNNCVPGTKECLNDSTVRFCPADGRVQQTISCEHGCFGGECGVCTPETQICRDEATAGTCAHDGSGWIEEVCGEYGCIRNRCALCEPNTCFCRDDDLHVQCSSWGLPSGSLSCSASGHGSCDMATGTCSNGFTWCR